MKRISLFIVLIMFVLQLVAQSSRYAESSVLSVGDWYKIQVEQSGIHKITYEQLVEMGVKNPANVSVFGYGGAQLPEAFSKPYIDDLPQLSIYMEKGTDGVFGKGDYILFYAQGPIKWEYNTKQKLFEHEINTYSKYGYYFVTSDFETTKFISLKDKLTANSSNLITSFNDYYLYEKDEFNLMNSGRVYLGDMFTGSSVSKDYSFKIANLLQESAVVQVDMMHTTFSEAQVNISVDNTLLGTQTLIARPRNEVRATKFNAKYEFIPKKTTEVVVNLTYSDKFSTAYLDYIVLNIKRKLQKESGTTLIFRNVDNIAEKANYTYNLSNANSNIQIWDISDQQNVCQLPTDLNGTELTFVDSKTTLKEYVAVDVKSDNFLVPNVIGKIKNQDLHALGQVDMIIIAHSEFVEAATRLANAHVEYDGISTHIVTPDVIYNEFSSGTPDATAYRRFAKMFYDRAKEVGNAPKYLLLFGDGSFDNRQILKANTKDNIYRLLTYQSKESYDETKSYTTDDYFGFLDDSDGAYILVNSLDIAVGRIPVYTVEQANGVVNKLIDYIKNDDFGAWKNQAIFLADDGDGNIHVDETDSVCRVFERLNPDVLTRKLYLDSYTQEVTAVGEFYPTLKKEFMDYINNGVLYINYMGHSGYNNWTNEQILTIADINTMYNKRLPLVVTASCSFSRFDDFMASGGEVMMNNVNGGALALVSATRTVFAQPNMLLTIELAKELLNRNETGRINTLGEAYKLAKNKRAKSNDPNRLPFVLLGDPAIRLVCPENHVVLIDSLNGKNVKFEVDTVGALGRVKLDGSVCFYADSLVDETFNGYVHITIFDKEETIKTLCNDATENSNNVPFVYTYRTNPLYVGQVQVVDGRFRSEFIIPKDIRYNFGAGRIVMYAVDEQQGLEANGYFANMIIGGETKDAIIEEDGPELNIYLNTPYFVSGDKVNENPLFVAELKDVSGINTIGSGIGHDIILKLDNDDNQEFVLNNYYEAIFGSYNSGIVTYPLTNLAPGKHKLFFRAWDLQNNSASAELEFEVVAGLDLSVNNVYVYPNPVQSVANLVIEHDRPTTPIDVQVFLYDIAGRTLYRNSMNVVADASSKINIKFDINSSISDGLYFVKVVLTDNNGKKDLKTAKIFVRKQ